MQHGDSVFKGPSSLLLPSSCTSRWGHASTMNYPRPSLRAQFVLRPAKPIRVLPVVLTKAFLVIINPDIIAAKKKMFYLTSEELAKIFAIISDKAVGKDSVFRCMHLSGS